MTRRRSRTCSTTACASTASGSRRRARSTSTSSIPTATCPNTWPARDRPGGVPAIRRAAEALFGTDARPAAILLTHVHPDHSASAGDLARAWDCPVYVHPDELGLATANDLPILEQYANPLDRRIILPLLHFVGARRVEAMLARTSLAGLVRALNPDGAPPGLPDWRCIPTPGHTPGHVAFFRASDRVLITGDAVLTVDVNSLGGWLAWGFRVGAPRVYGPPRYTNWNQQATDASIAVLAGLEPRVLAPGHGAPLSGDGTARQLQGFAEHLSHPVANRPAV